MNGFRLGFYTTLEGGIRQLMGLPPVAQDVKQRTAGAGDVGAKALAGAVGAPVHPCVRDVCVEGGGWGGGGKHSWHAPKVHSRAAMMRPCTQQVALEVPWGDSSAPRSTWCVCEPAASWWAGALFALPVTVPQSKNLNVL
jgi:hypothetical protein